MNDQVFATGNRHGLRAASARLTSARAVSVLAIAGVAAAAVATLTVQPSPDGQAFTAKAAVPDKALQPAPETLFAAPMAASVEMSATLQPSDGIKDLLIRSGVAIADANATADLIAASLPAGVPDGTQLDVLLGATVAKGERRLERLSFQPSRAFKVLVGRTQAGELKLARDATSVDATPQRYRGRAGSELFWSLRASGVPAEAARDYLAALATRLDLKQVRPGDEFDLVFDHWRASDGKGQSGPLLYASLRRGNASGVQLVRWTVGDQTGWFDPSRPQQRVEGFGRPVTGHVTSSFGYRFHPILGFARFHDGVDIGAAWGSPVFAAADGIVSGAGWTGGYGRQVRLVHSGGVMTSYSHLSEILAVPGTRVQRGQMIGLVGSSGLSTGPHLHFEVREGGHPVDPLTFHQATVETIASTDLAALKARLEQLRSI